MLKIKTHDFSKRSYEFFIFMSNQKLCNILYINVERKEMTANLNLKDKKNWICF